MVGARWGGLALGALLAAAGCGASGRPAAPAGDPCAGVDCDGHGTCGAVAGQAACRCDAGWVPSGPRCVAAPATGRFPDGAIWYQDVSAAAVDPASAALIAAQDAAGGWATGSLEIDFSIKVLVADASVPARAFTPTADFWDPDCDPAPVPVPPGGFVENSPDYSCPGGDCHLIVYQGQRLWELWRADISGGAWDGGTFVSGCAAVWDLTRDLWQPGASPYGRGDQCTSADAAGHPIAPLLFTAEELRAGEIPHAIRFILDNAQIRADVYVHPATHTDGTAGAASGMLPYGARLRLRADFDEASLPSPGARVVARALKRYGMFLSDAGGTPLTAEIGAQAEIGPLDLASIRITDFEVLTLGPLIPYDADCRRTPVTR